LRRHLWLWSLGAVAVALLAPGALAQLKPGAKAPDVTVKALNGKSVRLSQLRGNAPAVVNFFATW